MKLLILFLFFCCSLIAEGQSKKSSLQGIAAAGLVGGESEVAAAFRVSGGVAKDMYYGGIGLGFDNYRFRSIPLFADFRISPGTRQRWFLYGSAGYNFPYHAHSDNYIINKIEDKFDGGFYGEAGVGIKLVSFGKNSLLWDFGFSYKEMTNVVKYSYIIRDPPPMIEMYERNYHLGRIITKLSWQFRSR